ncbi:MAG: adenylate/guanylate cyclase domain-containing protein [Pseudomonadota bacterium]
MSKLITNRWLHIVLLLSLLAGIIVVRMYDFNWTKSLRNLAFDTYNNINPRNITDDVVVLDIDEKSLAIYGQFPWERQLLARMVDTLQEKGAKVITFDMVFAEVDKKSPKWVINHIPENPKFMNAKEFFRSLEGYDERFTRSITEANNVVTGFVWSPDEGATRRKPHISQPIKINKNAENLKETVPKIIGVTTNIPILSQAAAGNGLFGVSPDVDGIIRKVPLLFRYEDKETGDVTLYPSLALETLRVLEDPREVIKIRKLRRDEINPLTPPYMMRVGKYEIPFDESGNFYGYFSQQRRPEYIPAWEVLDNKVEASEVKDKIIVIGTSAEGLRDIRSTPLDLYIPGVELHVNVIEQVLTDQFLLRPGLIEGLELTFTIAVGLIIILLAPFINAFILFVFTLALVGATGFGSYYAFLNHGLLIDPVYPSLSILLLFVLSSLLSYLRSEAERAQIKGAFGLYVSPDFMDELTKDPDKLKLGGEVKDLTVMFTDIRSFTTISESLTPEELIQLMNNFLTPMSDLVMNNRGTIDKYMGDAMMAFWNAPLDDPEHARNACLVALRMDEALQPINQKLRDEGRDLQLNAGIGINTGPCSIGNMGSKQRFAYSALGDAVNLASRLEGQTKSYGVNILIGEDTKKTVSDFAAPELDLLQVKGKTQPVKIYTLIGDQTLAEKTEYRNWLKCHNAMLAAYRIADFGCAAQDLKEARETAQDVIGEALDFYYDMYAERIAELTKNPPSDDWDGVFVATSK